MNEKIGQIFSIVADNAPVAGCTVSRLVKEMDGRRISHFSLAAGTDISPETYSAHKLWIVAGGEPQRGAARAAGKRQDNVRAAGATWRTLAGWQEDTHA